MIKHPKYYIQPIHFIFVIHSFHFKLFLYFCISPSSFKFSSKRFLLKRSRKSCQSTNSSLFLLVIIPPVARVIWVTTPLSGLSNPPSACGRSAVGPQHTSVCCGCLGRELSESNPFLHLSQSLWRHPS